MSRWCLLLNDIFTLTMFHEVYELSISTNLLPKRLKAAIEKGLKIFNAHFTFCLSKIKENRAVKLGYQNLSNLSYASSCNFIKFVQV